MFNSFLKLDFSKKLAVVVTILYILMVFATTILKVYLSLDITNILEYVQYSFVIVLSGYILKSGAENITKIKVSDLFKKKEPEITNNESEQAQG